MTVSVRQLALAVNGCGRITSSSLCDAPGIPTWEIDVMNQYGHIIDRQYHTGGYRDEAEQIARERCSALKEFTWRVYQIK